MLIQFIIYLLSLNMGFLYWFLHHKLLLFFIAATAAFGVSTVVLGVKNCELSNEPLVTTSMPTITTTLKPLDMEKYILPNNVIPDSYDLYLYPDLATGLFKGIVTVSVDLSEDRNDLILHNNGLNIISVLIDDVVCEYETDLTYELLVIRLPASKNIGAGTRLVKIEYSGDMKNRIVGLYTSSYKNEENNKM